jgi:hypothetical protein
MDAAERSAARPLGAVAPSGPVWRQAWSPGWELSVLLLFERHLPHGADGEEPGNALTLAFEHEHITEVFTGFGEKSRRRAWRSARWMRHGAISRKRQERPSFRQFHLAKQSKVLWIAAQCKKSGFGFHIAQKLRSRDESSI